MAELNIDLAELLRDAGCSAALLDAARERIRQVNAEGWTAEHDDQHSDGSLAAAAACYAYVATLTKDEKRLHRKAIWGTHTGFASVIAQMWPDNWDGDWFKPKNDRRDLVRAAALIIAEIERIDRIASRQSEAGE